MICSTLSGSLAIKHPVLNILCREDGKILVRRGNQNKIWYEWSFGHKGDGDGYFLTRKDNKTYKVHRLICEAFHLNKDNKPCVDHINRDRKDNRPGNLRWATCQENAMNQSSVEKAKEIHKGMFRTRRNGKNIWLPISEKKY